MIPLVLPLLACSSLGAPAPSADQVAAVLDVTYSDLMRDFARYDGRAVRLTAFVYFGIEGSGLYDPDCANQGEGDGIWIEDFTVLV